MNVQEFNDLLDEFSLDNHADFNNDIDTDGFVYVKGDLAGGVTGQELEDMVEYWDGLSDDDKESIADGRAITLGTQIGQGCPCR